MKARYVEGCGQASKHCDQHYSSFNCTMLGTFNAKLESDKITDFPPSFTTNEEVSSLGRNDYRFLRLSKDGIDVYGWAVRGHRSRQNEHIAEILTKTLIPDSFKEGIFDLAILEKWDSIKVREWAKDLYWFQSFDFSPVKRADSGFVWDSINVIDWKGKSVLDIGCHYGYHAFQASKLGANVVGFDTNVSSIQKAIVIGEHIEQQDVRFYTSEVEGEFDIILYLSVHHQIDSSYSKLKEKIEELKSRAKGNLFVELIVPPLFPKRSAITEKEMDAIVGGKVLAKYKHKVRGVRKIYHVV